MRAPARIATAWRPLLGVLAGGLLLPHALAGGIGSFAAIGFEASGSAVVDPARLRTASLGVAAAILQGLAAASLLFGRQARIAAGLAGVAAILPWLVDLPSGGPWSRCGVIVALPWFAVLAWMARSAVASEGVCACSPRP